MCWMVINRDCSDPLDLSIYVPPSTQVSIKEAKDGLDFFYTQRSHAIKMCEFLAAVTPVK